MKLEGRMSKQEAIDYLKEIDIQNKIDRLAKKYKNKKVVIYAIGILCQSIFENYDLSDLNIVAVSDKKFIEKQIYKGIKAFPPEEILAENPDIVLIGIRITKSIITFFERELFQEVGKFKYDSLISEKKLLEKIKDFLR
ncbi:MAG: hypothetical protein JXB49_15700 [Bacteroidales bacterium]|nr:hypothetical protein [Bacteroidales bacterium]